MKATQVSSSSSTDREDYIPVVPDEMSDIEPNQQVSEESDSDPGFTYELSPIIGIDELLKVRAEDKYYYEEDTRPIFQKKPKSEPQPKRDYIYISDSEDEKPRKKKPTKGMSIEEDSKQEIPLTEEGKNIKKLSEDKKPFKAPHRPKDMEMKQPSEETKQKLTEAMKELTEKIQQK